ncbi:POC1 centriolar protein like B [Dissostichus eleginoides]|uniref:POC1 centriolar protein like B n=1 Tax=Dissostichus eleginoides TaxID=100907 RepID=A0AAD9BRS8_DISEL|nr:POC1 centriolar protein like B [Dissostichus eleginoides]
MILLNFLLKEIPKMISNYSPPPPTSTSSNTKTVSVLEERLTLTEDKLKECLLNQSQILKDVQSGERRRSKETDGSPVHFT